jgi:transposase
MPRSKPPYPPELRRRLVEMVRAGRSPAELAEQFEPSEQCIRNWVKQADRDSGKRQDGLTTAEKDELGRLREMSRSLLTFGGAAAPGHDVRRPSRP